MVVRDEDGQAIFVYKTLNVAVLVVALHVVHRERRSIEDEAVVGAARAVVEFMWCLILSIMN